MKDYFITFRSVTYAQKGEAVLRTAGIRCALQRTPRWMEQQGCGYSVRLEGRELSRAMELLQKYQIPFRRVYGRGRDGEIKEVLL